MKEPISPAFFWLYATLSPAPTPVEAVGSELNKYARSFLPARPVSVEEIRISLMKSGSSFTSDMVAESAVTEPAVALSEMESAAEYAVVLAGLVKVVNAAENA